MASGGMAEIYLAKKYGADGVQKFVAFKRILAEHASSEDFIRMFKDEAKIAVNLSHSNVVSIFDFGAEKKQLYLVMEYVEGKNLRQLLNRLRKESKRFSISHIAYITKLICAGLDHAHRCIEASTGNPLNIIHRDMSPQNVMVSYEGEVKIIDFGIAKATTQAESTRVGTLKGKFGYMSPEQVDGLEIDPRTDLFATGTMLWEMLAEQRLFLTNNEMGTLRKIRECKIPSLREIDPNIPYELEKIVNKSLSRSKSQRYQTAAEMQKDLQSFLNRYNPDFSSQDFSEFIKNIYADQILEARQRQVTYAQIKVDDTPEEKEDLENTVAMNQTQTNTAAEPPPPPPSSMTATGADISHLDFKSMTKSQAYSNKPRSESVSNINQQAFINAKNSAIHQDQHLAMRQQRPLTHSKIAMPQMQHRQKKSSSSFIGLLSVLLAGFVGGFAYLNETQPKTVSPVCNELKKYVPVECYQHRTIQSQKAVAPKLYMRIQSSPTGADIYVDGQDTGLRTPAKVEVNGTQPFNVSLALAGHRTKTKKFKKIPQVKQTFFKLSSIPTGWFVVKVVGGVAFYGKKKLRNGAKVPVEANKKVTIKARNPITQAEIEETFTVREGETKTVLLSPR